MIFHIFILRAVLPRLQNIINTISIICRYFNWLRNVKSIICKNTHGSFSININTNPITNCNIRHFISFKLLSKILDAYSKANVNIFEFFKCYTLYICYVSYLLSLVLISADNETRTHMRLPSRDFKSLVSANSTISAFVWARVTNPYLCLSSYSNCCITITTDHIKHCFERCLIHSLN